MGRDVPFNRNAVCDSCGKTGAYDFMGDYVCPACLSLPPESDESVEMPESQGT